VQQSAYRGCDINHARPRVDAARIQRALDGQPDPSANVLCPFLGDMHDPYWEMNPEMCEEVSPRGSVHPLLTGKQRRGPDIARRRHFSLHTLQRSLHYYIDTFSTSVDVCAPTRFLADRLCDGDSITRL
jgi:hypothetical protein